MFLRYSGRISRIYHSSPANRLRYSRSVRSRSRRVGRRRGAGTTNRTAHVNFSRKSTFNGLPLEQTPRPRPRRAATEEWRRPNPSPGRCDRRGSGRTRRATANTSPTLKTMPEPHRHHGGGVARRRRRTPARMSSTPRARQVSVQSQPSEIDCFSRYRVGLSYSEEAASIITPRPRNVAYDASRRAR